jgi:hypothetical protein
LNDIDSTSPWRKGYINEKGYYKRRERINRFFKAASEGKLREIPIAFEYCDLNVFITDIQGQ